MNTVFTLERFIYTLTKVYQILFVIFAVFIGTGATAYEELRVGQTVVRAEAHGAPINNLTWNLLSNTKKNPYLREGKEYIDMYGWDKYDFLNRTFDTWILRTLQPDPMADMYYGISPYALWANNPLKYIDPTGMMLWKPDVDENGSAVYTAEQGDNIYESVWYITRRCRKYF